MTSMHSGWKFSIHLHRHRPHFAFWLGLSPGTKITGGKVMSGKTKAVTAAAHKLARLIYAMLTQGQDYYEERDRQRGLHHLAHKAKVMGMQLVPAGNIV